MKTALITGASSGIGTACMLRFAAEGYQVIGIGRDEKRLLEVRELSLQAGAADCVIYATDIGKLDDLSDIGKKLGLKSKLDVLVNCAGVAYIRKIEETSVKEWQEVMNINMSSAFFLIQALLGFLERSEYASIVNVASIAGRTRSLSLGCHYTTSKAAMIGMTKHLAAELGSKKIRVNCTAPSQTISPMLDDALSQEQQDQLAQKVPLGKLGEIHEQADVIYYLCTPQASYINGAIIDVNGGLL